MRPVDNDEKIFETYFSHRDDFLADLVFRIIGISNINRIRVLKILKDAESRPNDDEIMDVAGIRLKHHDLYMGKDEEPLSSTAISNILHKLEASSLIKTSAQKKDKYIQGPNTVTVYKINQPGINMLSADINAFSNALSSFTSDKTVINKEEMDEFGNLKIPLLKIIGGSENGKVFAIKKDQIRIGRIGELNPTEAEYGDDLILSNDYTSVTRIEKPHLTISKKDDKWYALDMKSSGGTFLNNEKMEKTKEYRLKDNDLMKLSLGSHSVELVFIE